MCNRLVYIIEQEQLRPGLLPEVVTGLNALKLDYDHIRTDLYEKREKELKEKKESGAMTITQYNHAMTKLALARFT